MDIYHYFLTQVIILLSKNQIKCSYKILKDVDFNRYDAEKEEEEINLEINKC